MTYSYMFTRQTKSCKKKGAVLVEKRRKGIQYLEEVLSGECIYQEHHSAQTLCTSHLMKV